MESQSQTLALNRLQVSVDVKENSRVCLWNCLGCWLKAIEQYFQVVLFIVLHKVGKRLYLR